MIKRNKRNIGKIVKVNAANSPFHDRVGKVMGFRGDHTKKDPYVEVFIYDKLRTTGSIYPFAGSILENWDRR